MPVKRELGKKAFSHLADMLSYDNFICQCLSKNVEVFEENIFAYLSTEFVIENIEDYTQGGQFDGVQNYLASYILEKYKDRKNCVAIFDDVMASPGDAFLEEHKDTQFLCGESVCHYVDLASSNEENLSKTVWATSVSWHFVCIILEIDEELTKEDLSRDLNCEYVIQNIKEIVVGAFDGEGFIHSVIS